MRNVTDVVNSRWNQWVVGYTARRQSEWRSRLGVDTDRGSLILWLTAAATLIIAAIATLIVAAGRRRSASR